MTLKLVDFPDKPEPPAKDAMIAVLEDLLKMVRNNEIGGVVACYTTINDPTSDSGHVRAGTQDLRLLGRLEYAKARLTRDLMEEDR